MHEDFYETDKALSEYLLFHYGEPNEVLPWDFGPANALNYPIRCITECINTKNISNNSRALDLGCAVGRSTFELAKHCTESIGIDLSDSFISAAKQLQDNGKIDYSFIVEGEVNQAAVAKVPSEIDRSRVSFEQGDAMFLRNGLGRFDIVLMINLIDRLPCPKKCLEQLASLIHSGGQLIIASPCTWLEDYTPKTEWLGGWKESNQPFQTLDKLREILTPSFELNGKWDIPFLIREHARKYQWSVAMATRWVRS